MKFIIRNDRRYYLTNANGRYGWVDDFGNNAVIGSAYSWHSSEMAINAASLYCYVVYYGFAIAA